MKDKVVSFRFVLSASLLIVALAIPLFFLWIGSYPLFDPDEPYYAVPAFEMLRTGTWKITIFNGQPWFDKPILYYWIILAFYHLFGVSEAAARLGSALAALVGALAVFIGGRKLGFGNRTALVSAIVLATAIEYAIIARAAVTDMTLTMFLTVGMLAMALYLKTNRCFIAGLAGISFGLAILTKGPVGLLLPLIALLAYALLAARKDLFRPGALAAGAAGIILSAGPWYLYMFLEHWHLLIGTFIQSENIGRFLEPEHHVFPLYYGVVLMAGFLPWSGALPAAIWRNLFLRAWREERGAGRPPGQLYMLCWFGAVLAVFSVTASKLPSYILPAFPPAALMIGEYWSSSLAKSSSVRGKKSVILSAWLGFLLAAAIVLALLFLAFEAKWSLARPSIAPLSIVLLAGATIALVTARRGSLTGMTISHACTAALMILILVNVSAPRLEPLQSGWSLVRDLEKKGISSDIIAAYNVRESYSIDFYLRRTVPRISDPDTFQQIVAKNPDALWIVITRDLPSLTTRFGMRSTPVFTGFNLSAVRLSSGSESGNVTE